MSANAPTKLTIKDYKSELHNDWCAGCVSPDTRIVMEDSTSRPISDVKVGDRVLGHDGKGHVVTDVMSHLHPDTLHRVRVKCFGELFITSDHPMYVVRRQRRKHVNTTWNAEWIPAGEVKPGDYLAYPRVTAGVDVQSLPLAYTKKKKDTRSKPLPGALAINDDFLRLAGYYIAEGYRHERSLVMTFGSHEQTLVDDAVALIGKVTELTARTMHRDGKGSIDVLLDSSYLAEIFADWFGSGAENKRIPEPLMSLPAARQRELIRGLWLGDGWRNDTKAHFKTISPVLAQQVKTLLIRQGAVPTISAQPERPGHRKSYAVEVVSARDYSIVRAILGEATRERARGKPPMCMDENYIYLPIRKNEVVPYDGMVHNLEVADVHSYVTEAGALHNCGDFGILTSIQMALAQLQLDPDKVAVFSGIGCSGKTPHYINAYGFHTLHGRVLTVATGARLANTNQTVLALGGDGDGYGIGAGYFVGAGRRNVDFAYIVHNNNVYGLTKGQASPTLAKGKKTKSMPEQSIQDGINPVAMAIASGYTFIARAYALEPKYTAGIIARAIEHRGAALVDVLQTCPTYNDLYTKEWYEGADLPEKRSRLYKLEAQGFDGKVQDPTDAQEIITKKAAAVARSYEAEPIPIGVYYEIDLPTYEDEVFRRIPGLKETPLVEQNSFERDIDPLLEAMR
ncbi:MAG: thiamine pyrophosphate-dependent enzyme [Chloroflexota bacterium]